MDQSSSKISNYQNHFQRDLKKYQEKWKLDILEGNTINYTDPRYNAISTKKYTLLNICPKIFFEFFRRWQNLFIVILSIIMQSEPKNYIYNPWIFDFPLAISLIFYTFKEIYLDFIRWKKDKHINNQKALKTNSHTNTINELKWKDIEVGSIIYMKQSEVCPADIILLDSSEVKEKEAFCIIDTSFFNGKTCLDKKKASSLTQLPLKSFQKNKFNEYKNLLSGTLEYNGPCLNPNFFQGFFKIRKDPKVEQLNIDHFIPRGSVLVNTEWIYGLVVYTGHDTKIYMNTKYSKTKRSFLLSLAHTFWIFIFIAMIACSMFLEIMYIPSANMGEEEVFFQIFKPIISMIPLLPLELFFIMDIVWIGIKFIYEKQLIKTFPSEFFQITDPNVFSDFAHVEYALFDKTGTLTETKPTISSIFFNGKIYGFENKSKFQSSYIINTETFEIPHDNDKFFGNENTNHNIRESSELEDNLISDKHMPSLLEKNLQNLAYLTGRCRFIKDDNNNNLNNEDLSEGDKVYSTIQLDKFSSNFIKAEEKPPDSGIEMEFDKEIQSQRILLYNPKSMDLDEEYLKIDEIYDEEKLIEDAKQNQQKFFTLFEFLIICHYSFPKKDPNTGIYHYISKDLESETILKFCDSCGFRFETANRLENPDEYIIFISGFRHIKYKILGIIDFTSNRKVFSIIYQNPISKQYILLVKGNEAALRKKIQVNSADEDKFKIIMRNFMKNGLNPLIYAYKILDPNEAISYHRKITNLKSSLINQSDHLEELAEEMETNLQIITVVGFQENIKPEAKEVMDFLLSVNIKPWILTGDLKEKALGVSMRLEIISQENEPLIIETSKKEDIVHEIRNILSILKIHSQSYQNTFELKAEVKQKKKNLNFNYITNKYFLLINGQSLNIIDKDPYLKPHLDYICYLVKTVIGYNLSPWDKKLFACIIKRKFPRKPICMAVGDGYNDILMLQSADVGVEVVNKNDIGKYEPIIMAGDIKISNLKQIKEVMVNESLANTENLSDIIYYIGHKSILLGFQIFLYNFYNGFTIGSFHDSTLILLYFFYFPIPLEIFYGIFYNRFDKNILQNVPELYLHGLFIKRKRQQKKLILGVFVEGIITSVLIFYSGLYVVNDSEKLDGTTNDFTVQSLTCFYACLIIQSLRMFGNLFTYLKYKTSIFLSCISILQLAIFLIVDSEKNFTKKFIAEITLEILSQFAIIMIILFQINFSIFFELFMKFFFFRKWFPNPYDRVVGHFMYGGENSNRQIINNFLKESIKKKIKFSSLIKKIFKKTEWIDVLIQQMLSPDDIDAQEMKLNRYNLKILDGSLERKYIFLRKKKALKFSRGYYLLLIFTFTVYVIFDLIFNEINTYSYFKIGIVILAYFIFGLMYMDIYNRLYYKCIKISFILAIIVKILFDWLNLGHNLALSGALLALSSTCGTNLNINIIYVISMNAIYLLTFIIRIVVLVSEDDNFAFSQSIGASYNNISDDTGLLKFNISMSLILLMIIITVITVYLNYKLDQQKRNEFLTATQIELESNKVSDILSILIPSFVRHNMIQGHMEMEEEHKDVSILFCDIYNFDKIISTENEKVVQILDNIYRYYDSLCHTHGAQKIETVGKTYMAASGIKICEVGLPPSVLKINKTSRLINMAFDMMKFIENVTYDKNEKILIKIGIHTGKIIAGVIGYHKPQFSLIGDTVNTTSRVCSTGEVSAITLSEEAAREGRSCDLHFTKKIVLAKGKGDLITFQVKRRGANESIFKSLVKNMLNTKNEGKSPHVKKSFFGMGSSDRNFTSSGNMMMKVANLFQENNNNNLSSLIESKNNEKDLKESSKEDENELLEKAEKKHKEKDKLIEWKSYDNSRIEEEDDDEVYDKALQYKSLFASKYLLIVHKSQNQLYDEFLIKLNRDNCKIERVRLFVLILVYLIRTLLLVSLKNFYSNITLVFFLRGAFVSLTFITIYFIKRINSLNYKNKICKFVITIIFFLGIISTLIEINNSIIYEDYSMSFLEIILNYLVHSNLFFFSFLELVVHSLIMLSIWLIVCGLKGILTLEFVILFWAFIVFNMVKIHGKIHNNIKNFNILRKNESRRLEQESLVSQLLPLHAFEKLKEVGNNNKVQLTDVFHDVTLLFADIAGFTKYSAGVKPQDVVKMLKNLFTEFDKVCVKHKVYKVYTIGDCYVVMGFLQAKDRDPVREAKNVVNMGLSMIEIIRNVRSLINFQELDMRIGIHTGTIFGGIIGTDIVRYDIYGKDVLIANKMESNGVTGNIMVSENTKKLLEKEASLGYRFEKKKEVECKGVEKPISAFLIHLDDETETDEIKEK